MIGLNVTVKCYKVSLFQDLSLIESFKKKKNLHNHCYTIFLFAILCKLFDPIFTLHAPPLKTLPLLYILKKRKFWVSYYLLTQFIHFSSYKSCVNIFAN